MKMNKRVISTVCLFALLIGTLAGCASKAAPAKDAAPAAGEKLKVAMVVNQKFGDNGPMDDMAAGAARAESDFGVEIKKLESASSANFEEDVRAMAKAGYNLIITSFPYMSDATKLIAQEYPDIKFSAVFQNINMDGTSISNVWDTEFHGEAAFYLGGYMAGKITKSNKIGLVIGGEEPTPNAEGNGFMRGVKAANPNATVDFAFVGSYEDPAKAKEIANAMISNGCDVLQTNSGASNAGVIEAAKDAGVLCTGEITDFYDSYKGFYGIIGIGFGNTVYSSVEDVVKGSFVGGKHAVRDLSNGGYYMKWDSYERFAAEDKDFGPALGEAIKEAKELEKKIGDGSLKIEFDTTAPTWDRIAKEG